MQLGNNHRGPWLAFDAAWFERHQGALLRALNAPVAGILARWLMGIQARDCPPGMPVLSIGPGRLTIATDRARLRTAFFTHPKYSKRVYRALRPLWWLMHWWDWVIPSRLAWAAELSFGLDTLTVYPDPSPGITTCDGYIARAVSESFASLHDGSGVSISSAGTTMRATVQSDASSDIYSRINRAECLFDTSPIGFGASINSATLSLYVTTKSSGLGETPLHLCSSSPAINTTVSAQDYQNIGSVSFGQIDYAAISIGVYNDIALNSSGIAAITIGGITKFGLRLGWDIDNIAPTWVASKTTEVFVATSDNAGLTQDPKLTVVYTLGGPQVVPASDAGSIVAGEAASVSGSVSTSDAGSIVAGEAALVSGSVSTSDAGSIVAGEAALVSGSVSTSDAGSIVAGEAASVFGFVAASTLDSGTISAVEVASVGATSYTVSSIEEQIFLWLSADPAVAAIVSDRVYPARAPVGAALPCATYQRISDRRWHTLGTDTSAHRVNMQISAWADSYASAVALGDAIASALADRSSAQIARVFLSGVGPDISDAAAQAYGRIIEVDVWEA